MRKLIEKSISISPEEFYLVESDLFIELSNMKEKPDFVVAFLELSSWMGTSLISDQVGRSKSSQTRPEDRDKMAALWVVHYIIQIPVLCGMYALSLWLIVSKVANISFDLAFFDGFLEAIYDFFCSLWASGDSLLS